MGDRGSILWYRAVRVAMQGDDPQLSKRFYDYAKWWQEALANLGQSLWDAGMCAQAARPGEYAVAELSKAVERLEHEIDIERGTSAQLATDRDDAIGDADRLADRIITVADEAFGPFPVQRAEEAITEIERGIHETWVRAARYRAALEIIRDAAATHASGVGVAQAIYDHANSALEAL